MKNKNIQIYSVFGLAILLASTVFVTIPKQAYAFDLGRIIDPACLFACSNDKPTKRVTNITNTYTDSNNVNSNINSPGATVIDASNSTNINNSGAPTYAYDYDYPVYTYPTYDYPHQNDPLRVSCYVQNPSVNSGETVHWLASAYGGNGSYNYSWTGSDGLSGYGSAISKVYYTSGYKNATVRVVSGSQTISKNCDSTVYVSGDYYDHYPTPTYPYYPTPTYPPYSTQYPIVVSCSVTPTSIQVGGSATWTAYVSGGNGYYNYSWSGTDGLYGSSQSVYNRYYTAGTKYGSVTVYSNGQTVTRSCNNSLNVGSYAPYPTTYNPYPIDSGLNIGCYPDPANPRVNQPITWTVEVTGGQAPYNYSWTGSDGLSGSQSTALKYYSTTGEKSAIISVTSADGRSVTRACGLTANVRAAVSDTVVTPRQPVVTPPPTDNGLSAAALFSLKNVPWGWVAVLVILVLFATVLYLLFNREKI